MQYGRYLTLLSFCLLAACGGGGSGGSAPASGDGTAPGGVGGGSVPANVGGGNDDDGDGILNVGLDWSGNSFGLFEQVRYPATATGFQGHTPNCMLLSGSLPPGMALQPDCALTGRPTVPGSYTFGYRVGASGVGNTLDFQETVSVRGPSVSYQSFFSTQFVAVNGELVYLPQVGDWSQPFDFVPTWSYRIASGALPPGVALDPATGLIRGTVAAAGTFDVQVEATLATPFGTYVAPATRMRWEATTRSFTYALRNSSFPLPAGSWIFKGEYFQALPQSDYPGALQDFNIVSGTLPAGLAFDRASGAITGIPTAVTPPGDIVIEAAVAGVNRNLVRVTLPLEVRAFATVSYPAATGTVGTPLQVLPDVRNLVNSDLVRGTLASAPGTCNLPAGVTLEAGSGVVSGTPTVAGTYDCVLDFELDHFFIVWRESANLHLVVH